MLKFFRIIVAMAVVFLIHNIDVNAKTNDTIISEEPDPFVKRDIDISKKTPFIDTLFKQKYTVIKLINQKEYVVELVEEGEGFLVFKYPFNKIPHEMKTSGIEKITYFDGTEKFFQEPEENDEGDAELNWENVEHTFNEKEIEGMYEIGEFYSRFDSETLKFNSKILEKNAIIVMKRKAIRQNVDIVLIKEKKINKAYGELPYIEIWGTGFSYVK